MDPAFDNLLKELSKIENCCCMILEYQKGTVLFASPSVKEIFGYDPDFFTTYGAEAFFSIIHEEDVAKARPQIAKDLHYFAKVAKFIGSIPYSEYEMRVKQPSGQWKWLSHEVFPYNISEDGRPERVLSFYKDISPRKEAENLLWRELTYREQDEAKLKKILDQYNSLKNLPYKNKPLPENVLKMTYRSQPKSILSQREKDIVKLIALGYSSAKISEELSISENTVETHRKNMMRKYNVSNIAQLIMEVNKEYWLGI